MQDNSAAVILAAGSSNRMKGVDKLWHPIAGRTILARTVEVFEASPLIDQIVLVVNASHIVDATVLCEQENWQKIAAIIPGGESRQASARLGLNRLTEIAPNVCWVMIHDGARPFVTSTLLEVGMQTALQYQAAIPVVGVKDTIKEVRHEQIRVTLDRSILWAAQTPQIFSLPLIYQAHRTLAHEDATDDATLIERLGQPVATFPGAYTNIKITTQDDLIFAEALIARKQIL